MRTNKAQKSEKRSDSASQRGRKPKETERNSRRKKEENPLHKRLKSDGDGDRRKTRREFFTEQFEKKPRSTRERRGEDKERKTTRSYREGNFEDRERKNTRSYRERDFEDKERKNSRFRKDDDRRERPNRRFDDEERKPRGTRERNFEDNERRNTRPSRERNFEDRERKPARSRRDDDRRISSSRRNFEENDRKERPSHRRFEDDDRKERPSRRHFEDDDRRERPSRRRFENEESNEAKPRRRKTGMESEIVREIVRKRRETGRVSERKPKVLALSWNEDRGLIRLNKYIANSGICSRREADDLILAGTVTVNGEIVTELGAKVNPTDEVRYEDKILQREKPIYILLNKPKDYITTTEDDRGRDNVMLLIEGACQQRVYPVGRLDRNTTGLLLFTNDGEMTKKLTHPRFGIKKIYQVELDKDLKMEDFQTLKDGIELDDGFMQPDELEYVDGKNIFGITLHSGKNRIVRRLFGHLGYEVEKLDRVYYAGLTKKNLPRGEWRILQQQEVNMLKMSI